MLGCYLRDNKEHDSYENQAYRVFLLEKFFGALRYLQPQFKQQLLLDWADHIVIDAVRVIEIDLAVVVDIDLEHLFEVAICPDQTEKSD